MHEKLLRERLVGDAAACGYGNAEDGNDSNSLAEICVRLRKFDNFHADSGNHQKTVLL